MKNKLTQQGFTLIEVAIVIALMVLLVLLIHPVYSTDMKKNTIKEGIALATTAKIAVNLHATNDIIITSVWIPPTSTAVIMDMCIYITETTGISVSSHGKLMIDLPSHYPGEIVISFSPKIAPIAHNELVLSPRVADPNKKTSNGHELPLDFTHTSKDQLITWECNSANPPAVNHGTHGNLDAKLAPADCRS